MKRVLNVAGAALIVVLLASACTPPSFPQPLPQATAIASANATHQAIIAAKTHTAPSLQAVEAAGFKAEGEPRPVREFLPAPSSKEAPLEKSFPDWQNNNELTLYVKPGVGVKLWVHVVSERKNSHVRAYEFTLDRSDNLKSATFVCMGPLLDAETSFEAFMETFTKAMKPLAYESGYQYVTQPAGKGVQVRCVMLD